MKNLLASTAIALVAMAGAASAQSVLQRVLTSIEDTPNASTVNGTFANIAENIGVVGGQTEVPVFYATGDRVQIGKVTATGVPVYATVQSNGMITVPTPGEGETLLAGIAVGTYAAGQVALLNGQPTLALATGAEAVTEFVAGESILNSINGSITNTMEGIAAATASNGSVFAINEVTVDIGDLTTTVLGAVNTGDIALGANMNVSEAVAGASQAIHGTIDQIGGSVDTAALVLNIASNSTDVLGNVNNTFTSLNGSIGNVATTVLGAVNTGTITNGLNASINGTISDLVGASNN